MDGISEQFAARTEHRCFVTLSQLLLLPSVQCFPCRYGPGPARLLDSYRHWLQHSNFLMLLFGLGPPATYSSQPEQLSDLYWFVDLLVVHQHDLSLAFCWLCWSSPEVVVVPPSLAELVSLLWVLLVLLALSWVWSVDVAKHSHHSYHGSMPAPGGHELEAARVVQLEKKDPFPMEEDTHCSSDPTISLHPNMPHQRSHMQFWGAPPQHALQTWHSCQGARSGAKHASCDPNLSLWSQIQGQELESNQICAFFLWWQKFSPLRSPECSSSLCPFDLPFLLDRLLWSQCWNAVRKQSSRCGHFLDVPGAETVGLVSLPSDLDI